MTKILIAFCIFASAAEAKDKVVVVLDTGLDITDERFVDHLCRKGHRDFTGRGLYDYNGHGTHVMGLIKKYAPKKGWCAIIVKYYVSNDDNVMPYENAWKYIEILKPDYVNISGGGNYPLRDEKEAILNLPKMKVIAAVGNDGLDLRKKGNNFYPAKYQYLNIIPVGSLNKDGTKSAKNNYGLAFIRYEIGEHVLSTLPGGAEGEMSGSSMATAAACGKIIRDDLRKK